MPEIYANVFERLIGAGMTSKQAFSKVRAHLEQTGRTALFPKVAHALSRLSVKKAHAGTRFFVANKKDAAAVKKIAVQYGAKEFDICVDETLIGGWRMEQDSTLVDASYKRQLLDIFRRITH